MADHSNHNDNTVSCCCSCCVILVCGLPGAGKSSAVTEVIRQTTTPRNSDVCSIRIEYDQVQADLLVCLDNGDETAIQESTSSFTLDAWRSSRREALNRLKRHLQEISSTGTKRTTLWLDDNFYLQSMRKQVYQICRQECDVDRKSDDDDDAIFFGTVWYDTPIEDCLARNSQRDDSRGIPEDVIHRMQERFEAPTQDNSSGPMSHHPVLRLDGRASLPDNVALLQSFAETLPATGRAAVAPPIDPAVEEARLTQARNDTAASRRHKADQCWRRCVAVTCRTWRQHAARANAVRKECLAAVSVRVSDDNDEGDNEAELERLWVEQFLKGISIDLTMDEREELRQKLVVGTAEV